MRKSVTFKSSDLIIAGNLFTSDEPNGRTIVIGHPGTAVKEQSPALYAQKLSEQGFTLLTFDAAYQGESEGSPRGLENPAQRVEDFKAAVSFLSVQSDIDPARIGILGICASGGYAIPASVGDPRVKAVATIAAVDVGLQIRAGADGNQDPSVLINLLEAAAEARTRVAAGEEMGRFPVFPAGQEEARAGGLHVFEGWEYYCTDRCSHPRSARSLTWDSVDRMATFDAFRFIEMISPRPLLMITAENAVTAWMTLDAFERAKEPKMLYVVDNATHVDLYDREASVNDAVSRLVDFFLQAL
ncbi:alpha/beta hydrolase [Agrobacterium tumefaciens]|uniref:alpha/beta hydrolase n=1 Tax=Agrobacterium tumefaciens TaxID=358 RepID=UPI0021CFBEAC|nr:alpha/beta hydrolase [Agrobacterium tumefaciens]UXS03855.1 alpha/beta hydrolase [Agrobacterium tumefaciens]